MISRSLAVETQASNLKLAGQRVTDLARSQGFALVGIAAARPSDHAQAYLDWLGQNFHGEMDYLARNIDLRLDISRLMPGVRSIICVAESYALQEKPVGESSDRIGADTREKTGKGTVAGYARMPDYHQTMKKKLHRIADELAAIWPEHQFRCAVDTAPIFERPHAQRAGLGWIGKNTLLIHPKIGSCFLLGEILTTLPLPPAQGTETGSFANHCGTCTRCIDACPTQCLTPYHLEARRCISYLTLEHRSDIEPSLQEKMGHWIAGCDVCQEVCPFNQPDHLKRQSAQATESAPLPPLHPPNWDLLDILNWTAADRQQALIRSALKRVKLDPFKRNALIAAGNHLAKTGDLESPLYQAIQRLADSPDESELVRNTAGQQCRRLSQKYPPPLLWGQFLHFVGQQRHQRLERLGREIESDVRCGEKVRQPASPP